MDEVNNQQPKPKRVYNYKNKKPNWKNATWTTKIEYKDTYPQEILARFQETKEQIYYQFNYRRPSEHQESIHYSTKWVKEDLVWPIKSKDPKIIRRLFPTFQRRATDHWVTSKTLISRCDEHKEFGKSHALCKEIQEAIAQEGVLLWIFNAQFIMFLLKNNHWRRDEQTLLWDKERPLGVIVLPQRNNDGWK